MPTFGVGIRFDSLVLNDVGPHLEILALSRIANYVGQPGQFNSFEQAVKAVRSVSESFGPHTDEQWAELAHYVYSQQNELWVKHYDLALFIPLANQTSTELAAGEQILWQSYEAVDCPILIVRGEQSDLLTSRTAGEMVQRNPRARLHTVAAVGHAPTLMVLEQIEPVATFLVGRLG